MPVTLTQAPAEEQKPGVTGAAVPLGTRVDAYPSSPLPELNSGGGPAFAARLKGDGTSDLMAILCTGGLPTRIDAVNSMRTIDHPAVLRLVDHGVVAWPDGMRYAAFAYQRPLAPRFKRDLDETHAPMSEDAVNHRFVQPLVGALSEFMRTGIFHGAIRPTNIFWRYGSTAPPQLGDCLSAPPGLTQPALFTTIERGMCVPLGRGMGSHSDDCYALGVTLALFVLGHNPLKGLDDAGVLRAKMEHGTFNTLIGHHHLSPNHIELYRGLLTDDAHQRWTAADLDQWLSGRRLTTKSSDIGRRANRSFEFAGRDYWQPRLLADAFSRHVNDAARLIDSGALDKWLRRSLDDEDRAEDVQEAIASLKESGKTANYEDQLVARACIALDPSAPIRYRGLVFMPDGFAGLMAQAIVSGGKIDALVDVISSQLVPFWIEMQKQMKSEMVPLTQQFDRLTTVMEKATYGNGIERAVYELNPTLPCLSPILRGQYVMTPRMLLPSLEHMAGSSARSPEPMDRHIAAFLIVRDRKSELLMESMSAPEGSLRRGLAMLTLYAEMQNRHGPESLPGLAKWLAPALEPVTRRFFGKSLREHVQSQIREAIETGDLGSLGRTVDNPGRVQRDEQEFVAARLLYLNILKEINALEGRLASRDTIVKDLGRPLAATLSSAIALLAIVFTLCRAVWASF